jgi:hypothetical protein
MERMIDMSPQAVTNRMRALDSLWELAVALKSSRIVDEETDRSDMKDTSRQPQQDGEPDTYELL